MVALVASPPLLTTKLYAPRLRPDAVERPALVRRLDEGLRHGHGLIMAPAGFGKSTLAAAWSAQAQIPVAWLSLEEDDGEPLRFLAYLTAALRSVDRSIGASADGVLHSSQPPPPEAIATRLLNDIAAGSDDLALVLDDYHLAETAAVADVMAFLVDHAPARLHLVLTTRERPALPIARLRARGRLTELGGDDLRFRAADAAALVAKTSGIDLGPDDADRLERRTEGWAAGLQLVAVALRGDRVAADVVADFGGDNRHVFEYVSEEVLDALDPGLRRFVLRCSVLPRLSAPLCDAVTGASDGADMLERLVRANLFVVPLDDAHRWLRFHALFADVLRTRARRELAPELPALHLRASRWFERHDDDGAAIAHALAADDGERAAELLERAWRPMDRAFRIPTWDRRAGRVPESLLRARPVLAVAVGWSHLGGGDLETAERWLATAEQRLAADAEPRVADPTAFRALPARIAAARSYIAQARGDLATGEAQARRAVELAPDDDPGARALPAGLLGLAAWSRGDLERALADLRLGMQSFRKVGDAAAALSFVFGIADILVVQGKLRDALATYDDALRYAAAASGGTLPGEFELHVGLAEVAVHQGDAERAERELRAGEALGDAGVLTGDEARLAAARARVEFALGHAAAAHALLDEAEARAVVGPLPTIRPPDAIRARLWLAQGRLAEARAWSEALGDPSAVAVGYLDEYTHLTVARVHLALHRSDGATAPLAAAVGLLDRVLADAETGGRDGTCIEARVLRALARRAMGDDEGALRDLVDALRGAEPDGHRWVFVREGPALAKLLRAAARAGAPQRAVRGLLRELDLARRRSESRAAMAR